MRILISLVLSVVIEFVLMAAALFSRDPASWILILFMSWPLIFFLTSVGFIKNNSPVDMIKMQNYYNLDAMRRNSDRMDRK
jgi:hypothetical protein